MARSFWKGNLSFGLVEIPVRLRPAVTSDDLSFDLLDRKDFSPVGYKRYNKNTGREVPWDRVIRGYEYQPDEYVVLSDEELKRANVKATQSIEIVGFVDQGEIDPAFFDTPYYVEPQKKDSKSYALLRAVLEKTGRVAIARVVLRTRQRLAALLVRDSVLVLNLLRYPHELRDRKDLEVPETNLRKAGVSDREIKVAEQLIEGMSGKWDPSKFRDEYRDDVMALVQRKIKAGQTHTVVEPETGEARAKPTREVVDLMPLLKESLAAHASSQARARPRSKSGRTVERRRKKSA